MVWGCVKGNSRISRNEMLDIPCLQHNLFCEQQKKKEPHAQLTVTQFGTRSHLFMTNTTCLWDFSFLIYSKTESHIVPKGSRASRMCRITSEESITLYSSPYMRREVPFAYIGSLKSAYVGASTIDEARGSRTNDQASKEKKKKANKRYIPITI